MERMQTVITENSLNGARQDGDERIFKHQ